MLLLLIITTFVVSDVDNVATVELLEASIKYILLAIEGLFIKAVKSLVKYTVPFGIIFPTGLIVDLTMVKSDIPTATE